MQTRSYMISCITPETILITIHHGYVISHNFHIGLKIDMNLNEISFGGRCLMKQ